MKRYKKLILIIFYIFPCILLANLSIEILVKYRRSQKNFIPYSYVKYLIEKGYYPEDIYPYKETYIQYLNPTTAFSLPITKSRTKHISNENLKFTKNSYRYNPYLINDNSLKKCIILTGGSTAFGIGASSDSETIPAIINKKLGDEYRVFNLAKPSWNSRQELISVINFLGRNNHQYCKTLNSYALTSTNDIAVMNGYLDSKNISDKDVSENIEKLFMDEVSRIQLIGAPESFGHLYTMYEKYSSEKNIFISFLKFLESIRETFFGRIIDVSNLFYAKTFSRSNDLPKEDNLSQIQTDFIDKSVHSFYINHQTINSILKNYGGSHTIVLQPNLLNAKVTHIDVSETRKLANKFITNYQKKFINANLLDLRKFLIADEPSYKFENEVIKLPLLKAVKHPLFNRNEPLKHSFIDNVHLTDIGANKVAKEIIVHYEKKNLN